MTDQGGSQGDRIQGDGQDSPPPTPGAQQEASQPLPESARPNSARQAAAAPEPSPAAEPAAAAVQGAPPPASGAQQAAPNAFAAPVDDGVPRFANGKPRVDEYGEPVATQSRLAAAIICWFLGVFGIHRFYVGKIGTGILMIVTLGGLGVWVLIDFIVILIGSFRNKEGLRLYNW